MPGEECSHEIRKAARYGPHFIDEELWSLCVFLWDLLKHTLPCPHPKPLHPTMIMVKPEIKSRSPAYESLTRMPV